MLSSEEYQEALVVEMRDLLWGKSNWCHFGYQRVRDVRSLSAAINLPRSAIVIVCPLHIDSTSNVMFCLHDAAKIAFGRNEVRTIGVLPGNPVRRPARRNGFPADLGSDT